MSKPQELGAPESHKLRVLIADGSPVELHRLRQAIEELPFAEISGEANTCQETLDLFFHARPDVVVVSIALADQSGFEVLRCVNRAAAGCAVILTTRWLDPFVEDTARILGATSVCCTTDGFVQLRTILQGVADSR